MTASIKSTYPSLLAASITNPRLMAAFPLKRISASTTATGSVVLVHDDEGNIYRVTVEPVSIAEQRLQDAYLTGDMQSVKQAACEMERNTIEQGAMR